MRQFGAQPVKTTHNFFTPKLRQHKSGWRKQEENIKIHVEGGGGG